MATIDLPERPHAPLPVAVSQCLLGAEVRYDGTHKRDGLNHQALAGLFAFEGICPEVGIGMGVPRDPIQLVGEASQPRARGVDDPSLDVTDALDHYGRATAERYAHVCGYIFMRNSPSCGLYTVKLYPEDGGVPAPIGRGIHAAAITRDLPHLPVEENERLDDAALRESFITRVFCYAHWRLLEFDGVTAARLIAFHSRYKYLLMAHSVVHYQRAGRLLGGGVRSGDVDALARDYLHVLMAGLAQPATRGGHANVMQHLAGYVSDALPVAERDALAASIHAYRRGELSRAAPLGHLRAALAAHGGAYENAQIYLEPYPGAGG